MEKFQHINNDLNELENLKSVGLSSDEINLVKDYEKGEEYLNTKHKNLGKDFINSKINTIKTKIEEYRTQFANNEM